MFFQIVLGHSDVVTITDTLRLTNDDLYIITAAGDCTVKVWIKQKNYSEFFVHINYIILM